MTSSTGKTTTIKTTGAPAENLPATTEQPETALITSMGRTTISDTVVEKVAGIAAREVNGVYKLGTGAARAFGAVRERIPGARTNHGQGVSVEVGERQAAIDIDLVVEYGVELAELTKAIRRNIITSIEQMTALEVTEVNISVGDVHIPGEDDGETPNATGSRVQ